MLASLSGRRSGLFVLCLVTALLLGCATSPTGRRTLILHSGPEMAAMGVAAFTQMRGELPRSTNASQRALVQCVADAITGVLTPQDLGVVVVESWEVELFEDDSANAFALPGGKMGVYTGLLNVARSPSQLAAVMGHEVGHVLARHGNERMSGQMVTQMGMGALTILAGESSPEQEQLLGLLGVGTELGLKKFSRIHESEADEIGLVLMARAGFDPTEAVVLWQNMSASSGGPAPPEFMSTHPSNITRIADLRAAMPAALAVYRPSGPGSRCR